MATMVKGRPSRHMLFLAGSILAVIGESAQTEVTPIQKVTELLQNMVSKGEAAKKEETAKFEEFETWCSTQKTTKSSEISDARDEMSMLQANIEKASASVKSLSGRLRDMDADVSHWRMDMKSIKEIREKEKTDFDSTFKEYSDSIQAIDDALARLKEQGGRRTQIDFVQSLMLQIRNVPRIPHASKKALVAYLQKSPADDYDFQSGGIVDMLDRLRTEFREHKAKLEGQELSAQQAFEKMVQQLTSNIEQAEQESSKKEVLRNSAAQDQAEATGDLQQTSTQTHADEKYLDDTVAMCEQRRSDFKSREKVRSQELETIRKVLGIISNEAVDALEEKRSPAFVQRHWPGSAFVQLRGGELRSPSVDRVAALLSKHARHSGSRLLAELSQHAATAPFSKVKKMVKDLIVKLMEEAASEMEHKGFCDAELATNLQTRDAKSSEVASLQSDIEMLTADISTLAEDISVLMSETKELSDAMAKATQERMESKATNEKNVADAKESQTAIVEGIRMLKEFYDKAGMATALVQHSMVRRAHETFSEPYTGMASEGSSVISMLEVILSDCSSLESDATAKDAQEARSYDEFMLQSKTYKAMKESELDHKQATKTHKESDLTSAHQDLKLTQDQLDKAIQYYEKLKPTCVHSGVNYEDRARQRNEEVQSLQEALKILSAEA